MDFQRNRPPRSVGLGDASLPAIIATLTEQLQLLQEEFVYETLHLEEQVWAIIANILVEFQEDLHNNLGIWRSLESYNRGLFGTPLPLVQAIADTSPATPDLADRIRFLLWTLYAQNNPDLILSPAHQDLRLLATFTAKFLEQQFARLPKASGIKQFLGSSNRNGWDVKRKLVWLGQHSYLFRLSFQAYLARNNAKPEIRIVDDFICQENTLWSGLGVIDILAELLPLKPQQKITLRSWYERHLAFYRIETVRRDRLTARNLFNDQEYQVHMDKDIPYFKPGLIVSGSLYPWNKRWYWSGEQSFLGDVSTEALTELKQRFAQTMPKVIYRYKPEQLQQAQESLVRHRQNFLNHHQTDFVVFPDGLSMAASMQKIHRLNNEALSKEKQEELQARHDIDPITPRMPYPDEIINNNNGVALFFNPDEGTEMMVHFNDVVQGLTMEGQDLGEDEDEAIRQMIYSDALSPNFVERVLQDYSPASITTAFVLNNAPDAPMLDYLLRCHKGHFYRNRYPQITIIGDDEELYLP